MELGFSDASIAELAKSLGCRSLKTYLLRQALTHSSYAREQGTVCDNERLEFLGDAVLKLVVSEELMRRFPNEDEGRLSKIRAYVVSDKALATVARKFGLEKLLLLGKGAEKTGERSRNSVLADAMEAIFGAVYVDCGLEASKELVLRALGPAIELASRSKVELNYKEMLQEYLQRDGAESPKYRVVDTWGPDHERVFVIQVIHGGEALGKGKGKSKKDASQMAAKAALIKLGLIEE